MYTGAARPAEVLKKLRSRITVETERKLPDEQRLLRALMKEGRIEKRKELLYEAFKPAKSIGMYICNMTYNIYMV